MERISLTASPRETGKGIARRLRSSGSIPAVLYGRHMKKPLHLKIDAKAFEVATKASPDLTALVDLTVDGGGEQSIVMIRDFQADVISRAITHLDLQAIDLKEKIELEIPVRIIGIPVGVKDDGGVLEQIRRKIHIKVLPTDIPSYVDIDVSQLKIGDSIHADEVKLPQGVEFPHATNYTLVTVVPPAKEEEVAVAPAAAEGEGAPAAGAETAEDQGKEGSPSAEKQEKQEKKEKKKD